MTGVEHEAGAVLVRFRSIEPELLLVTTRSTREEWSFPKGHVEPGETAQEAAVREAREESGVVGEVICGLGASRFQHGGREVEVAYYLLDAISETEAGEGRRIRWVSMPEAERLLSFEGPRRLLPAVRDAIERRGRPRR
jgi:8-oxo-dGTP pyrophosphatase MutT (NUDIX family)